MPVGNGARPHSPSLGGRHLLVFIGLASATGVALVLAPVVRAVVVGLCLISVAWVLLLPRGWFADSDPGTQRVIRVFLALRLAMPLVFQLVGNFADLLFTGGSDSLRYHRRGTMIVADLLATGASRSHGSVPGTGALELAVGYFYYAVGAPVRIVGDYAWNALATVGILLFWWATNHLAGDRRVQYSAFVLLAPTLLFWNAGISKEAAMTFATGCVVAGVFLLSQQSGTGRGLAYVALAIGVAGAVRPHIALLLTASAVVGIALGVALPASKTRSRRLVPLLVAALCLIVLIPLTKALIDPGSTQSLTAAAYAQAENTAAVGGRSSFETSPTRSLADMPGAVITVLLRPFVWEVRTVPQLMASLEALVIGSMLFSALWSAAKRRVRFVRSSLVVMSVMFTLLFCASFASLGNFGLLVRERVQVLAFVILLIFSFRTVPTGAQQFSTSTTPHHRETASL